MKKTIQITLLGFSTILLSILCARAAENELIVNGGFENDLSGWQNLWSREKDAGEFSIEKINPKSGAKCAKIVHNGKLDWSLNQRQRIPVSPGEWYEFSGWFKLTGEGEAQLCAIAYDASGNVIDWAFGGKQIPQSDEWTPLRTIFPIPQNTSFIVPRIIGSGAAILYADDISLKKTPAIAPAAKLPETITIENSVIKVVFTTSDGAFNVLDKRINHQWIQKPLTPAITVLDAKLSEDKNAILLTLFHPQTMLKLNCSIALHKKNLHSLTVEIAGAGKMAGLIGYPFPFVTEKGTYLVIPMNEGISYPVDDNSINPIRLIAYGGHGICMGFWGVTDGQIAQMTIIETPDDGSIQINRFDGKLAVYPLWEPQKGEFGYPRRLQYLFFDKGDHVRICKQYREYAKQIGLFKTLEQKRKENPNVDMLIGAVNIWCWEKDAPAFAKEIMDAGIKKILWSNAQPPENLKKLNEMGILTSRYDIYQDVMDPANFKYLRGIHSDWTTEGWDKDIVIDAKGRWVRGWGVKGTNDQWYYCGVLCDKRAVDYAKKRVPAELKTHPYRCRFIDTTTASPFRECYNTNHPMTRTESKIWRMNLLNHISTDMKLVCGSETGHEAAVPYLHYFEGMLSLGPYRVPDAGRNIQKIWDEPPEQVVKFQLGHRYRLPLWELVYHDCVVAQWYWGDYNNKLPSLWDKRDLFNALYGTPPMFMFNRQLWEKNKERFVKSYNTICPIVKKVGYSEMVNHKFLTPDRDVQQTEFANGVKVTVNFGSTPYTLPGGKIVKPMDLVVEGP
ncbi:MAG: glycoside hydrolase [Verrucomicrobiia bacterium]